ncbi:MAG: hypothetical protein ACPGXX_20020, partial [Planctomycetaceae bacterium]
MASNGARLHPRDNLTPEAVVRVDRLARDYDELDQRLERIARSLRAGCAELPVPEQRFEAQMSLEI